MYMVVFPNAKINIGLNIISKRTDGYHNIQSCFYPVETSDILEILPSDKLQFSSTGLAIPGERQHNLCLKAYRLLKADYDIPAVHIHLHKLIPIGAGLGGGSSDATFTLKTLNTLFELGIDDDNLEHYAAQLGSDCPFFVRNKPVLASGTGNEFSAIDLDLSNFQIKIDYPDIHIGTQEAYAGVTPKHPEHSIADIIEKPLEEWKGLLVNDFEESILKSHPTIRQAKEQMYAQGALYASMTGSGSAVYGIFSN